MSESEFERLLKEGREERERMGDKEEEEEEEEEDDEKDMLLY